MGREGDQRESSCSLTSPGYQFHTSNADGAWILCLHLWPCAFFFILPGFILSFLLNLYFNRHSLNHRNEVCKIFPIGAIRCVRSGNRVCIPPSKPCSFNNALPIEIHWRNRHPSQHLRWNVHGWTKSVLKSDEIQKAWLAYPNFSRLLEAVLKESLQLLDWQFLDVAGAWNLASWLLMVQLSDNNLRKSHLQWIYLSTNAHKLWAQSTHQHRSYGAFGYSWYPSLSRTDGDYRVTVRKFRRCSDVDS